MQKQPQDRKCPQFLLNSSLNFQIFIEKNNETLGLLEIVWVKEDGF